MASLFLPKKCETTFLSGDPVSQLSVYEHLCSSSALVISEVGESGITSEIENTGDAGGLEEGW